jgi:hypothetical protein
VEAVGIQLSLPAVTGNDRGKAQLHPRSQRILAKSFCRPFINGVKGIDLLFCPGVDLILHEDHFHEYVSPQFSAGSFIDFAKKSVIFVHGFSPNFQQFYLFYPKESPLSIHSSPIFPFRFLNKAGLCLFLF